MSEVWAGSVVLVAVGSNIEPERNILAALAAIRGDVRVVASSTFYRTEPIGRHDQPRYINGVWRIDTDLLPVEVRDRILRPAEIRLGRQRIGDKFGPRTIDLDLVLYGDQVVHVGDFRLPHPDLHRPFVYSPVVEVLSQNSDDVPGDLRERMMRLLPTTPQGADPGEPLPAFTRRIRESLSV